MSRYCKCFFSNKKKYLLEEKQNPDSLLYYYDKIHNSTDINKHEFSQTEYNNTLTEVNKLKQKLLGK
jgi:hypothetical protein